MAARGFNRPPDIKPNYGRPRGLLPRTRISQVLLHDNTSQQQLLTARMRSLEQERRRQARLLELNKKSFIQRQAVKQRQLRALGITHLSFMPERVARAYCAQGDRVAGKKSSTIHTPKPVLPRRPAALETRHGVTQNFTTYRGVNALADVRFSRLTAALVPPPKHDPVAHLLATITPKSMTPTSLPDFDDSRHQNQSE